ncbi:MAG: hypothetical protein ACRD21_02835 [Vicinamibacteria bacterium]
MSTRFTLYLAVALSALVAGLRVYRYDLYNREPWYMIAIAGGFGFGVMRVVGEIELWSLGYAGSPRARRRSRPSTKKLPACG